MKRVAIGILLFAAATTVAAQPSLPPPFPRTNATQLFENDTVRIWDIVWPKGQPTALHRHIYDQVGTYYEPGGRTIRTPDGAARTSETAIGALSTTRKGTTHIEEGNSVPPLRAVFVELKKDAASGLPGGTAGTAGLPRDGAKPLLDDDRVAVWDYVWTAGPQGLEYRPDREVVIVWLGTGTLRVTRSGRETSTMEVKPGTVRHLDRGSGEVLQMTGGAPRAMFFEIK